MGILLCSHYARPYTEFRTVSITAEEWEAVKADQLGRYYRTHAKAATVTNVQTGSMAEPANVQTEATPEPDTETPAPDAKKHPKKPPQHLKLV